MSNFPLISVVMPCYNAAPYISCAIDALLAQTYQNLEIIIVDDNSTDNVGEVVEPFLKKYSHIHYVKNPRIDENRFDRRGTNLNAGWSARNFGVSLARGELITFQDADDGSCSNRIQVQYDIMKKYNSHHVNIDWQQYRDEFNGKYLNYQFTPDDIILTSEILAILKSSRKGLFKKPFGENENNNPFEKIIRTINRKYLRDWPSYPTTAGVPLVKREVFKKCHFRILYERTMPASSGRGTDCDFNFWVAETFKDSIAVKIPLYLWRVKSNNLPYLDSKYHPW